MRRLAVSWQAQTNSELHNRIDRLVISGASDGLRNTNHEALLWNQGKDG
jgi:hypothetical protein